MKADSIPTSETIKRPTPEQITRMTENMVTLFKKYEEKGRGEGEIKLEPGMRAMITWEQNQTNEDATEETRNEFFKGWTSEDFNQVLRKLHKEHLISGDKWLKIQQEVDYEIRSKKSPKLYPPKPKIETIEDGPTEADIEARAKMFIDQLTTGLGSDNEYDQSRSQMNYREIKNEITKMTEPDEDIISPDMADIYPGWKPKHFEKLLKLLEKGEAKLETDK